MTEEFKPIDVPEMIKILNERNPDIIKLFHKIDDVYAECLASLKSENDSRVRTVMAMALSAMCAGKSTGAMGYLGPAFDPEALSSWPALIRQIANGVSERAVMLEHCVRAVKDGTAS